MFKNPQIYSKIDWYTAIFQDMTFNDVLRWVGLDPDIYVSDFLKTQIVRCSGYDNVLVFNYEGVSVETSYFNYFKSPELLEVTDCFDVVVPIVRLDISGRGLDFLRSKGLEPDSHLRDYESAPKPMHITRADFAYDLVDYKPDFLDTCIDYVESNHTKDGRLCIYHGVGLKYSLRTGGEKTLYIGSKNSDKMLRIYDKKLQYYDLNTDSYIKPVPFEDNPQPYSWIRIELQTRNKVADSLIFGDGDMLSIFRYIFDTYCFSDVANTTKQNRVPAKFWQELFDWQEIPRIIQNFHSSKFISRSNEIMNAFDRSFMTFLKGIAILEYQEPGSADKYINDKLREMQDFDIPFNNRRWLRQVKDILSCGINVNTQDDYRKVGFINYGTYIGFNFNSF